MIAPLSTERLSRLRALVLVAMDRANAGSKKPDMEQLLDREEGLVRKGAVDLGYVWRRLLVLGVKEPEAAMVLAQTAVYVSQKLQVPMSLPTDVGAAVEGALERLGDPAGVVDGLEQAVATLAVAQKEKVLQAAGKTAERPKVLLDAPKPEPGKVKPEPAKVKPEPAKVEPAKVEPAKPGGAPAARGRGRSKPKTGLLVAGLLGVLLIGGGLTLATQNDQSVPADAPLPTGKLAELIPLKQASVKNGVLIIAASGKEFDALDQAAQEARASEIFRLLKGRNVMVVELATTENEYKMMKNEQGGAMVLRVEPPEPEAPPEEDPNQAPPPSG